ncbi:MAG TPA: tyrosine-protein phosphatase [Stackebrandtia sp.]|jgi:protein-tyrosine phosphatase|uniref:tyrosine-protein phosphatase n=1 Tax=Stackebrandtia sp. TaxID=2023065 RepID=UPI002D4EC9FF|nr:tyrosine-protein phosphatase [Stackebrandtia sp.]HZE41813.1 tyrosine-protein phosphatase [Stackebrandtia sp.]
MNPTGMNPYGQIDTAYGDSRFVRLKSVFNLRDLGGLSGIDGRKVRTGLVYRSDQFGNANDADIAHLVDDLGLRTVVDFRRPTEIAATGSFPERPEVAVHHLELLHIRWEAIERDATTEESPVPFLVERYTAMIESGAVAIRRCLELMCDTTPLVFHCMAGKDRTGITAAITLKLLGVADADIAADYALTTEGMARYHAWRLLKGLETANWGLLPDPDAMLGLLANIDRYFGGVEAYARAIGFTRIDDLRAHLLT